jgi:hypothetical protein
MLVMKFGQGYKAIVMLQGLKWQARRAPGNPTSPPQQLCYQEREPGTMWLEEKEMEEVISV